MLLVYRLGYKIYFIFIIRKNKYIYLFGESDSSLI